MCTTRRIRTFCIVLLSITCLLFSCKNFLDADKTSEEIKNSINYNNAKELVVNLYCKTEVGIIYPQPTYKCKLGYEFEIQFLPEKDYYVIKDPTTILEAVSRTNPSVSLADYVEFTAMPQTYEDARAGLYRINAKVIKASDDILIQPVCMLRPSVEVSRWNYNAEGFFANTPITINFDMPMLNDDGTPAAFAYNNDTIILQRQGEDVSYLFELPVLNSEGTQLTIIPKPNELKAYIDDDPFVDITILAGQNIKIKKDNIELLLVQSGKSLFSIRYNPQTETVAPREYAFFATRKPIKLSTADSLPASDKLNIKVLKDFSDSQQILQNRTNGTVYIYGKYYDAGSGVKTVTINECLSRTSEGFPVTASGKKHFYTATSPEAEFFTDEIGNTYFCVKFVSEYQNGAITLDVSVQDACTNSTEANTFTIFRKYYDDSIFDNIKITNAEGLADEYAIVKEFNREQAYALLKEIMFTNKRNENNYDVSLFDFYKTNERIQLPANSVSIECFYKNESNSYEKKSFTQVIQNDAQAYASKIVLDDIEKISGMQFTIVISDDLGNYAQKTFNVPESQKVDCCLSNSTFELFYTDYDVSYNKDGPHIFIETDKENTIQTAQTIDLSTSYSLNTQDVFYLLPKIGDFFIEIPPFKIEIENYNSNNCDPVVIKNWTLEKSVNPGKLDLTVNIEENQGYDSVFIEDWTEIILNGTEDGIINYSFFQKNSDSLTIQIDSKLLYQAWLKNLIDDGLNKIDFFVTGIKGHQKSSISSIISITWDNNKYDNIPPEYLFSRKDYYNFIISIKDYSKLDSICVTNKRLNKSYDVDTVSEYECKVTVPIYDLVAENNYFSIQAMDIYNNELQEDILFDIIDSDIRFANPKFEDIWWVLKTKEYESNLDTSKIEFEVYHYLNNKWEAINSANSEITQGTNENGESINALNLIITDEFIPEPPTYIKVITKYDGEYADTPLLFYPAEEYSSKNDLIMDTCNSVDSLAISSWASVFVQTFSTDIAYEECKKWSLDEWEKYNKPFGVEILEFDSLDHSPKRYDVDLSKINPGECYCVIAHFADGSAQMSKIMQK